MANIARIAVDFVATTSKFKKGTDVVKKTLNALTNVSGGVQNALTAGLRKITTSALGFAGAMFTIANAQRAVIDLQGKFAGEIGIPTEKLAAYQLAARLAGTTTEELHRGLQIFVRRLGEMRKGVGEGMQALQLLGMTAKDFQGMNLSESFEFLSKQIAQMGDESNAAAVNFSFMGRAGVKLINAMKAIGGRGLEDLEKFTKIVGSALPPELIRTVENYNDSLELLGDTVKGIGNVLAVTFAPALDTVLQKLIEMIKDSEPFLDIMARWETSALAFVETFLNEFTTPILGAIQDILLIFKGMAALATVALGTITVVLIPVTVAFFTLTEIAAGAAHMIEVAFDSIKNVSSLVSDAINFGPTTAIKNFMDTADTPIAHPVSNLLQDAAGAAVAAEVGMGALTLATGKAGAELRNAADKMDAWIAGLDEKTVKSFGTATVKMWKELSAAGKKRAKDMLAEEEAAKLPAGEVFSEQLLSRANALAESLRTPLEVAKSSVKELSELFEKGLISQEIFDRGMKKIGEDFTSAEKKLNGLNNEMEKFDSFAAQSGNLSGTFFGGSAITDQVFAEQADPITKGASADFLKKSVEQDTLVEIKDTLQEEKVAANDSVKIENKQLVALEAIRVAMLARSFVAVAI